MSELTAWCDACNQESLVADDGTCVWCDGPVRKKHGGGRPKGSGRKMTDDQVRAAHRLYAIKGLSCRQLGALLWERFGYTSETACAEGIYRAFISLGLPRRTQHDVTVARNFKHGRKRRNLTPEEEKAYRVWLAEQRGWNAQSRPGQWRCAALKRQYPRKGERCARPSLADSDYCQSHDPRRELARQAAAARMRRKLPARDMLPFEPFAVWLDGLYAELGTLDAVAERLECSKSAVLLMLKRIRARGDGRREPRTTIGRDTAEQFLELGGGPKVAVLYGACEERAA